IEELLSGGATRVGFDVHVVTHNGHSAGFKLHDVDGPKIRRQPQRQAVSSVQRASANSGGMLRTRLRRVRMFDGRWFLGSRRKNRRCQPRPSKKEAQPEKRPIARLGKKPLIATYVQSLTQILC